MSYPSQFGHFTGKKKAGGRQTKKRKPKPKRVHKNKYGRCTMHYASKAYHTMGGCAGDC